MAQVLAPGGLRARRGKPWFLYSPDHVTAVMPKFANAGELEQAFRQMRPKPMGFGRHQGQIHPPTGYYQMLE